MVAAPLSFASYNNSLPPQNISAEESLLGGILLDPEAIGRIADKLPAEAFFISHHGEIYKAALALHAKGLPTDLMHVTSWLHDQGLLDQVGGMAKLAQLVERTVSAVNIDRYADLILDKFHRRQIISLGQDIVQFGHETFRELPPLLRHIEEKLSSLCPTMSLDNISDPDRVVYERLIAAIQKVELEITDPGFKFMKMRKLAKQYDYSIRELEALFYKSLLAKENEPAISLKELAEKHGNKIREWLLHGFLPKGTTVLLHAKGGVGKTRLMYEFAYHLATGTEWNGFSVTGSRRKGLIVQTDEQPNDMLQALEKRGMTDELPLLYKTRWSTEHIPQLRKEFEQHRPDFVIVDSLTTVSRHSLFSENDSEYARPVLLLTALAQEFNATIIIIHHSSKAGDARGTSAIFNSVSEVWKLSRDPQNPLPNSPDRILEIEKSRSRRPATYKLQFNGDDNSWLYMGEVGIDANNSELSTKETIVKFLSDRKGIKFEAIEVHQGVGSTLDHVRRCCSQLAHDGIISHQRLQRHGRPYVYFIANDGRDDQKIVPLEPLRSLTMIRSQNPDGKSDSAFTDTSIVEIKPVKPTDCQQNTIGSENLLGESASGVTDHLYVKNDVFLSLPTAKKIVEITDHAIGNSSNQGYTSNTSSDHPSDRVCEQTEVSDRITNNDRKPYPTHKQVKRGCLVRVTCAGSKNNGALGKVERVLELADGNWEARVALKGRDKISVPLPGDELFHMEILSEEQNR
jgi:archaellum biogenesis ATPase FlaH